MSSGWQQPEASSPASELVEITTDQSKHPARILQHKGASTQLRADIGKLLDAFDTSQGQIDIQEMLQDVNMRQEIRRLKQLTESKDRELESKDRELDAAYKSKDRELESKDRELDAAYRSNEQHLEFIKLLLASNRQLQARSNELTSPLQEHEPPAGYDRIYYDERRRAPNSADMRFHVPIASQHRQSSFDTASEGIERHPRTAQRSSDDSPDDLVLSERDSLEKTQGQNMTLGFDKVDFHSQVQDSASQEIPYYPKDLERRDRGYNKHPIFGGSDSHPEKGIFVPKEIDPSQAILHQDIVQDTVDEQRRPSLALDAHDQEEADHTSANDEASQELPDRPKIVEPQDAVTEQRHTSSATGSLDQEEGKPPGLHIQDIEHAHLCEPHSQATGLQSPPNGKEIAVSLNSAESGMTPPHDQSSVGRQRDDSKEAHATVELGNEPLEEELIHEPHSSMSHGDSEEIPIAEPVEGDVTETVTSPKIVSSPVSTSRCTFAIEEVKRLLQKSKYTERPGFNWGDDAKEEFAIDYDDSISSMTPQGHNEDPLSSDEQTAPERLRVFSNMGNPPRWIPAIIRVNSEHKLYRAFGSLERGQQESELSPRLSFDCGSTGSPAIQLTFKGQGNKHGTMVWCMDDRLEGQWLVRDFDVHRVHYDRNLPLDPVDEFVDQAYQTLGSAGVPLMNIKFKTRGAKHRAGRSKWIFDTLDANIGYVMKVMFDEKTKYELDIWFLLPFATMDIECLDVFRIAFEQREEPFNNAKDDVGDFYYSCIHQKLGWNPPHSRYARQAAASNDEGPRSPFATAQITEIAHFASEIHQAAQAKPKFSTQRQKSLPPEPILDCWEDAASD